MKQTLLKADNWLTEMLGRPAYHVLSPNTISQSDLPSKNNFLDARVAVSSIKDLHHLEALDFRLVETNLQLIRKPAPFATYFSNCRFAIPSDEIAVRTIASTSFFYDRFHLDPDITTAASNNLKSQWAGNFFAGKRGDWMVVALENHLVCGFLQLIQIDYYTICIDLIAVSPNNQGRGIAMAMIAFAASVCLDRPATLAAGTQIANTPSLALYNKLGFVMKTAQYVLHLHTSADAP